MAMEMALIGSCFLLTSAEAAAQKQERFGGLDFDSLGGEIATLSDGGAFANPHNSFRSDVCRRYNQIKADGSQFTGYGNMFNLSDALSGMEISVMAFQDEHFRYNDTAGMDPVYPGVSARLLDYMAQKGNFTWRNSFGVWKRDDFLLELNRDWTELLRFATEKYDIFPHQNTPSTERVNLGINFAEGHSDVSLIIGRLGNGGIGEEKISWFSFMQPFDLPVWFAIAGILALSSITYQIIESLHDKSIDPLKSFRKNVVENWYWSWMNFTGNYKYQPKTLGGQMFGVSFAFWAMLITGTFETSESPPKKQYDRLVPYLIGNFFSFDL